jgi:hypothetical protein
MSFEKRNGATIHGREGWKGVLKVNGGRNQSVPDDNTVATDDGVLLVIRAVHVVVSVGELSFCAAKKKSNGVVAAARINEPSVLVGIPSCRRVILRNRSALSRGRRSPALRVVARTLHTPHSQQARNSRLVV